MAAAQFDLLDLVTADMMATVTFYRLLGVRIPKSAIWRTGTGAHHADIKMPNGMTWHLDSRALARTYNRGWQRNPGGGNVVIGFKLATRRNVDATCAKLAKAGHKVLQPPYDAFWGARYAVVADPDGNHVGIMSPSDPKKRRPPPEL